MAKSKTESVKIHMSMVRRIICALDYLAPDLDSYGATVVEDYNAIVNALKNLEKSTELRHDYTQFINMTISFPTPTSNETSSAG